MRTLKDFNANRRKIYDLAGPRPRPNGIECPICGAELMDSKPTVTLMSNPPQKNVHCPKCEYRGRRIA